MVETQAIQNQAIQKEEVTDILKKIQELNDVVDDLFNMNDNDTNTLYENLFGKKLSDNTKNLTKSNINSETFINSLNKTAQQEIESTQKANQNILQIIDNDLVLITPDGKEQILKSYQQNNRRKPIKSFKIS